MCRRYTVGTGPIKTTNKARPPAVGGNGAVERASPPPPPSNTAKILDKNIRECSRCLEGHR